MLSYIINRILYLIPVLFIMSIVVFLFIHLIPGDPVDHILGFDATDEARTALRAELKLDRSIPVQYFSWAGNILKGDFGRSAVNNKPVLKVIIDKIPATMILAFGAIIIALIIAIPAGIAAAASKGTWKDMSVLTLALVWVSIPTFWLGVMLVLFFSLKLGWFPAIGYVSFLQDVPEAIRHLALPSLTLGAVTAGALTRMTRSEMIEQLSKDYVVTARAKGLSQPAVLYRHALRNSLITVVTFTGMELGTLIGGTVVTETIFAWPGIGQLIVQSIFSRDYPMIQGTVLFISVVFVMINLLVDISYTYLNPQINFDRKKQA